MADDPHEYLKRDVERIEESMNSGFERIKEKLDAFIAIFVRKDEYDKDTQRSTRDMEKMESRIMGSIKEVADKVGKLDKEKLDAKDFAGMKKTLNNINYAIIISVVTAILGIVLK